MRRASRLLSSVRLSTDSTGDSARERDVVRARACMRACDTKASIAL
jgi:hypothetical protein